MIWRAMRLKRGFKLSALVALAVPGLLALTAIGTLADSSATPSASAAPLPGDPNRGATLYSANCTTCHGASLEGGIGAVLNPIDKLPNVPNSLDPAFLIGIITNGRQPQAGDPKQIAMPAKGGNSALTSQDVNDLASYIIQQNLMGAGSAPLSPGELAKRTILWVTIGIIAMVFITYLLAQYNMRWVARRAAARPK
jgi:mono/diheme cytochrome c family protein